MMEKIPPAPRWVKRVSKWKIARVYEDDAAGIHDEDLINDVAFTLLSRCKSMLVVEEARNGRAACPNCETIIDHPAQKGTTMVCTSCGWTGTWNAYRSSMDGKHLIAPGILPFCREYIGQMPKAKTPKERMHWIDWLVHRVHWEGTALPGQPGAVCLIQGRAADVNAFLADLTAGTHRQPDAKNLGGLWSQAQKVQIEKWRRASERRAHKRKQAKKITKF
jgi:predicted RNA-binding Zn-ribbon protein involved in translation (DUF1610 family)